MSKIDLARENEQLCTAYDRARRVNLPVAIITCLLFTAIGWLLAGGVRPDLSWLRGAPAAPMPTPHVIIREIPTALPAYIAAPQSDAPAAAPAQERVVAPVSAATPEPPAQSSGIKVIVIKPADGGAPIVLRDGTKYRGRP